MDTYPECPRAIYEAVRDEIRTGDLLLASGSSAMSKMIQAGTDSVMSHVGVLLRIDSINRILVIESVESIGVRPCTLNKYVHNYDGQGHPYPGKLYLARHAAVSVADAATFCTFSQQAVDLFGCVYDNKQIAAITLRVVAAKLGLRPQPRRPEDNTFICSELADMILRSIGVTVPYNHANYIAPADFAACEDVQFLWELALNKE